MSISTLWGTPNVLEGLINVSGGGISSLTSPDNNLSTSVAGNVGEISLKNNITISGTVNCSGIDVSNNCTIAGITRIEGPLSLSGVVGVSGQYLVSQGASLPVWQSLPSLATNLKIIYFNIGNCDPLWTCSAGEETLLNIPISGLTAGKQLYVFFGFSFSWQAGGSANATGTIRIKFNSLPQIAYATVITPSTGFAVNNNISYVLNPISDVAGGSTQTLNLTYDTGSIPIVCYASTQFYLLIVENQL